MVIVTQCDGLVVKYKHKCQSNCLHAQALVLVITTIELIYMLNLYNNKLLEVPYYHVAFHHVYHNEEDLVFTKG